MVSQGCEFYGNARGRIKTKSPGLIEPGRDFSATVIYLSGFTSIDDVTGNTCRYIAETPQYRS